MAESGKCSDVPGAVKETAVLGIKLVGDVAKDLDAYVVNALKSEEVQNEIKKALEEIARDNVSKAPVTFSGEEAKKLATSLLNKSATAVGQDVFNQVKKSPGYRRLQKSAEGIVDSLKCSPTGVWFERNKKIIYILASGLLVGGAVGMYIARAGDTVAEPITSLIKGKKFTAKPIGTLEISAGSIQFTPSKREFQMELGAAADFKQIKAEVTVTGQAIDASARVAGAGGKVIIPFGKVVTRVEGSYDPRNMKLAPVQLGLGIEFTHKGVRFDLAGRVHMSNTRPTSGSISLGVRGTVKGIPYNIDLGGKLDSHTGSAVMGTIRAEW
ncbi:MAG TPA: hypothetical protein VJH03_24060 [Blastocatellia bacterium]|nr:hypothetical protein [Blastocatellia bacterium]